MENTRFESHSLYCDLVAKHRELDYVHDLSGILISINPMAAQSLGFEPEEMVGKEMSSFLHPAYRHLFADYLKRMATEKRDTGFLRTITRSGEERIWVYSNSCDEETGKPPLVTGYAQDITEFKKVESLNQRLVSLIEATSDFVATFALDGRVLYANAAFRKVLGHTDDKETPKSKVNDSHLQWAADLVRNEGIPAAIKNGIWRGETALLDKDGHEIPVSQAIIAHQSREGAVEFFSTIARDISEPKRAEEALRHNNQLFKAVSRAQAKFITEADSKVLFGDLLDDLLSLTQSEYGFIGEICYTSESQPFLKTLAISNVTWDTPTRQLYDQYSAVVAELHNLKPLIDEALTTGKPVISRSTHSEDSTGEGAQARLALCLPIYSGAEMVGMIGIANRRQGYDDALLEFLQPLISTCSNIIQAYKTEQLRQLAEQEVAKLSLVASKTDNAVVITNHKDLVEWVNDGFVRLTGYRLEEVHGKNLAYILRGPDTNIEASQRITELLKSKTNFTEEILNYRKDGRPYWVSINISPILNDKGEVTRFIGVQTEITERKLKQEELRLAKEAAEAASVAKSQFLAVMSHEIRTPLNAIIGMTDLALNTQLAADQVEFFKSVQVNSESLLYLINDILDYSKIEAGQIDIDDVPFKLAECVEGVVELLTMRVAAKRLEVVCDIAENLPFCVSGDANRLRQILVNLLGNAIKFTERGEVVIKVEAATSSDEKTVDLHCSIADTGIGIAKDKQAKIFDKFYQVDDSTTRQYGGSGIGLSISKLLVELMQGEIWLDSQPGKGSTFHFRMPFKIVEAAKPQRIDDSSLAVEPELEIAEPADDHKLRILLVEDNQNNQILARRILEGADYAVDLAENGEIAVQRSGDYLYDLILMDIQMPLMDGLVATQEIRNLEKQRGDRRVPIIALTANPIEGYRDKCVESGMDDFLTKPIKKERLLDTINQWIDQRPAVLIVDDSAPSQLLIKAYLKGTDYQLFFASNGQQALEFFNRHWVSLVLLDMEMPILDGYATAKAIRQLPIGAHLPIIAMTGHEGVEETNKCLNSGCSDYLGKPLRKAKILEAIRKNLIVKLKTEGSENLSPIESGAASNGSRENQAQEIIVYVEEDIEDLVPEFLEGRHEDVKIIKASIQNDDFVNVQRLGHDMKGCGQGYGFEEISLIGKHVEAAAKEKNAAEILHWNDRLEKYLAVIKVVIKRESL